MATNARKISLDTETTGLDPDAGDRIVEIGAVEMINDMPTGRKLHLYINPERDVPGDAVRVHGLTNDFLRDKPVFARVAAAFMDFIGDSPLVIHNADFDMKFLNSELRRAGIPELSADRVIDTMRESKRRFPRSPATLDALCRRFSVPLDNRTLHGALLDAELLGEVYLALNGGRQPEMDLSGDAAASENARSFQFRAKQRPSPLPPRLSEREIEGHLVVMKSIDDAARQASKGQSGALWAMPEADSDMTP